MCVGNLTIIGSDNGLSPGRRQAIIWTNAGISLIGPLGKKIQWIFYRNSNILIQENAFKCVVCELAAILSGLQCVKHDIIDLYGNHHRRTFGYNRFDIIMSVIGGLVVFNELNPGLCNIM